MANLVTTQGIEFALRRGFNITTVPAALATIGVDDSITALTAASVSLNGTNVASKAFATNARTGQTNTTSITFGTGEANINQRRLGLLNSAASTVSPLLGLYAGIDSGSSAFVNKSSSYSVKYTVNHTAANNAGTNALWVNQGLQVLLDVLYGLSATYIRSMGFDDGTATPAAGDTTFTGVTAGISKTFDSAVIASNIVTVTATLPKSAAAADMNAKTIKRININTQATSVAQTASAISGLCAVVYSETMQKETDRSIVQDMDITATSA